MPKVPTTPFGPSGEPAALPPEEADPALLCFPVRALTCYVDNASSGPQTSSCLSRRPAERECRLQAEDGPLDSGCHHPGLSGTGCALPVQVESSLYEKCSVLLALAHGASLTDICRVRAGRPLTHSLDSIAFVWNRFPPVFSPQTGRSTEGPGFGSAC